MQLSDPWFLLLACSLPLLVLYMLKQKTPAFKVPSIQTFQSISQGRWRRMRHLPLVMRVMVLILLIIALARPQTFEEAGKQRSEGIDMMLVLDVSESMIALDFVIDGKRRDRLYVVKSVVKDFIKSRVNDRLGIVVFGSYAYAQAPLTLDHEVLEQFLENVEIGMAGSTTAIGEAMAVAVNRLKDISSKEKVMVLLSDGSNTAGQIQPSKAIEIAKSLGVKVYTIGIGSSGVVPVPTQLGIRQAQFKFDEKLLKKIANDTGGKYFRAKQTEELVNIYRSIDELERTEVETQFYRKYEEHYHPWVWAALMFLGLEMMVGFGRFGRVFR